MREEKLINRGWQFALLPCAPIDAETAKKKELQRKQSGEDVRIELEGLHFIEVDLPHDRKNETEVSEDNIAEQGGKKDECVWYRKKFEMPESLKDKHFTLVFEGISIYADIYFNGSLIGKSTSPTT